MSPATHTSRACFHGVSYSSGCMSLYTATSHSRSTFSITDRQLLEALCRASKHVSKLYLRALATLRIPEKTVAAITQQAGKSSRCLDQTHRQHTAQRWRSQYERSLLDRDQVDAEEHQRGQCCWNCRPIPVADSSLLIFHQRRVRTNSLYYPPRGGVAMIHVDEARFGKSVPVSRC